jgi:hypothetical protein
LDKEKILKQNKSRMKMKRKILTWAPRVLAILMAAFLSMFAMDVFEEYAFPLVLVALFMHLIPTFALVIVILLAWRYKLVGGILFILLAIFYTWMTWGKFDLLTYLIIPLPVFLTGALFILDRYLK